MEWNQVGLCLGDLQGSLVFMWELSVPLDTLSCVAEGWWADVLPAEETPQPGVF